MRLDDGAYSPLDFEAYAGLDDETCRERIIAAKAALGEDALILAHHYQREEVFVHSDAHGDSLKLSRLAAESRARHIVFCGVHFMAETADILKKPHQQVILPDPAAGCSMADMADLAQVSRAWEELSEALDPEREILPITYINSSAALKAFCGLHGGVVCTSSNAKKVLSWALSQKPKVLFFPDQHLGRYTGHAMGFSASQMPLWDPEESLGGLDAKAVQSAKILLWKGHCSVHQVFSPSHIKIFREQFPDGLVISHPECRLEVCEASDFVGSTEFIIDTIASAPKGTHWLVGTELNLVNRLSRRFASEGKTVRFMSPNLCVCSTMSRIDPQHLAWTLDCLVASAPANVIEVIEEDKRLARTALERMLSLS